MLPNLDVLPVKASQDTTVKRKVVYLDQMVMTNIAKANLGRRLPDELLEPTKRLRDALKAAVREKQNAVLVESHFHRDESSGIVTGRPHDAEARALFDEIARFITYYSFGLKISPGIELIQIQAVQIVAHEHGLNTLPRKFRWRVVLSRDPQEPNEKNAIRIGGDLVVIGIEWQPRIIEDRPWADNATRMREEGAFPNYEATLARAEREWRDTAVRDNEYVSWASRYGRREMPRSAMDAFITSERLSTVPYLFVNTRLYAHVLAERARPYKDNDKNDIRFLSGVIPYSDLVITDRYMADAATRRGLDVAFHTKILAATPSGLDEAAEFLLR